MRNPLGFFVELIRQPIWIAIWVMVLMTVNMGSLFFWHKELAQIIFITFMASAMIMMLLYSHFGFEKILGLGHILWIPLLIYIVIQIPAADEHFQQYLIALSIIIAISLLFDIVDVFNFLKRKEVPRQKP